jgi:hypothetical protein
MPRIRTIKPDAFLSESLSGVPRGTRWTFAGLWTYADDKGRARDDARLIKAALYPLDDDVTLEDVVHDLDLLAKIGGICRYIVGGKRYLHMPEWHHQKINRPTPAKSPPCPLHEGGDSGHVVDVEDSPNPHGALTEPSTWEGKGREGNREGKGSVSDRSATDVASRPDVQGLCDHLADRIAQDGSKRPPVTKAWLDAARLMLDKDDRTEAEVHQAIDWCQAHPFWRTNVLSMPKLREKFDQLRKVAQSEAQQPRRRNDIDWELAAERARTMDGAR